MTGIKLLALADRHVGERYILGALAPKDNAQWTGPWDCAEFASWLVFQISGKLYGCDNNTTVPSLADAYSGYWARDARSVGQIVSYDEAARTIGAFVLREPQAGLIGHVVISDGRGGTVEAHSTKSGVIRGSLSARRWDYGVLPLMIQYTEGPLTPAVPDPAVVYRMTLPNMTGPIVRRIQNKLKSLKFNPGPVDGAYGPMTAKAVAAFQLDLGLIADGEVGERTARALGLKL